MKRPTWATVVGVLGIIFGLGGLFNSAQTAAMPKIIESQHEMLVSMEKAGKTDPKDAAGFEKFKNMVETFWGKQPAWFNTASATVGLIGIIINGFYIFAAIAMLLMKKYALKLFYTAIALSCILAVIRAGIMAAAFSAMSTSMFLSGLIGAVLDVVLLIVVLMGGKAAFREQADPA
jgi:hypothetical protein